MSKQYIISFTVDQQLVHTIIASVPVDRVSSLHIDEKEDRPQKQQRPRGNGTAFPVQKTMAWATPAAKAIVALMIKSGPLKEHWYKDLAKAMPTVGMGESSISPVLSVMHREGLVQKVKAGYYKLTEEGKAIHG